jgi:hypothetical protein
MDAQVVDIDDANLVGGRDNEIAHMRIGETDVHQA